MPCWYRTVNRACVDRSGEFPGNALRVVLLVHGRTFMPSQRNPSALYRKVRGVLVRDSPEMVRSRKTRTQLPDQLSRRNSCRNPSPSSEKSLAILRWRA